MSSIRTCHPQRPLRGEADSKEENEMFNDNRFAATNRSAYPRQSATTPASPRRCRVLPRVRPPAENRPKIGLQIPASPRRCRVLPRVRPPAENRRKSGCISATNRVAVLHEVRPYIGD